MEGSKNRQCLLCNKVYGPTKQAISLHMRRKHSEQARAMHNWRYTNEPRTEQTWHKSTAAKKAKKAKVKQTPPVILPSMNYVDIPVVLRVPLNIGQASIVQP